MDSIEARDALAQLSTAQTWMAAELPRVPVWRHAAFGTLLAILIGSIAWSHDAQVVATPLVLLTTAWLVHGDRKRMGVFVNGYRRGATLPLTLICLTVMVLFAILAMELRTNGYDIWPKLGLAALTLLLGAGFSVYWQRIFRLELKSSIGGAGE